jgi:asparagine synthase (glutamine-hydrolysing)
VNEIFGLISLSGHVIHPQSLDAMAKGCCPNGCHEAWIEDSIALGQVSRGQEPPIRSPISLPGADGFVLATGARLDNRAELLCEFGIVGPEKDAMPDDALVREACRRWGKDAPRHLHGDWHLALWDRSRRSLLLARDQWGHTALYYHSDSSRLAFATDIRAILALPGVPRRPDLRVAANRLMSWPGDGIATFHEGIKQLPPGHLLRQSQARMDIQRYWDPRNIAPLRLARDEDYVEAFLEHYEQAVQVRLRDEGPVAATLSGGLDSGSVVALAAPILGARGRELLAVTAVPDLAATGAGPNRFGAEWPLASETARMAGASGGRIRHLAVACQGASLLDSIERNFEIHLDPGHAVGNYHWIQEILNQCRGRGIRTLLTETFAEFSMLCERKPIPGTR